MKKTVNKKASLEKILPIAIPVLMIFFGIVMIVNPNLMKRLFMIFSIGILVAALIETVIYYAVLPYEKKPIHQKRGIILGVTGALLLVIYFTIASLIPFCIGVLLCGVGVFGIRDAFQLKARKQAWQVPMVLNALVLVMGVVVLLFTFFTDWIWILAGILMIVSGLLRIVNLFLMGNLFAEPNSSTRPVIDIEDITKEK